MCKPYLDPEVCTSVTDCRRIPGHYVAEVVVLIQSDTEVHTTTTKASNPLAKVVVAIVIQT